MLNNCEDTKCYQIQPRIDVLENPFALLESLEKMQSTLLNYPFHFTELYNFSALRGHVLCKAYTQSKSFLTDAGRKRTILYLYSEINLFDVETLYFPI